MKIQVAYYFQNVVHEFVPDELKFFKLYSNIALNSDVWLIYVSWWINEIVNEWIRN